MHDRSSLSGNERLPIYPLRVARIEPGQREIARMLSERYFGLMTHWARGRSVYCDPTDCCPAVHRTPRYWKGYAAAELWNQQAAKWFPVCLEITEHLELDFRRAYARGQVWELVRGAQTGKKKTPVAGYLLEECDEKKWPAAFDLVPVLRHLYHVERLSLDAKNPLPDRVYVSASDGDAPKIAQPAQAEDKGNAEDLRKLFRERAKSMNGKPA
jgi:hypothetical protein